MINPKLLIRKLLIFIVAISWSSCSDSYHSNIPDVPVNFEVNLLTPYAQLTTPGQFTTVTKVTKYGEAIGYSGLIIGNSLFNGYCAFDLCCPIEAQRNVTLHLPDDDGTGRKAVCDKCGSVFDLNHSGVCITGKKVRLKSYKIVEAGSTVFKIYN